jgi:hypothetical protein
VLGVAFHLSEQSRGLSSELVDLDMALLQRHGQGWIKGSTG